MREVKWKIHVALFLLFSAWGFFFEWFSGFLWNLVGLSPWIYPNSHFAYTSWKVVPLWGLGGLIVLQLSKAVRTRDKLALAFVAILQSLAIAWIAILGFLT